MNDARASLRLLPVLAIALALSACSTVTPRAGSEAQAPRSVPAPAAGATPAQAPSAPSASAASSSPPPSAGAAIPGAPKRSGGYYQDDGPADVIPDGLLDTPDAEPRLEPIARGPSRPYKVFEKTYVPITDTRPFVQRGIGSWYGRKFHGQKTASGEPYDMFKMTAAHPTLPIPSYARVTNLNNGRKVIVRINDRGPFHSSRIIDLSYTAALKLDVLRGGSAELEVERLLPDEIQRMQAARQARREPPAVAAAASGFFLQFGAYAQEPNAQAAREQLMRNWPAALPPPAIVSSQGLFRLHSGPYASRELASDAAQQLRGLSSLQSTVVQR